jgi:hypothetical protein
VALYGVAERAVLAWGEGHSSWVSRVAFDTMVPGSAEGGYRPLNEAGTEKQYRCARVCACWGCWGVAVLCWSGQACVVCPSSLPACLPAGRPAGRPARLPATHEGPAA